MISGWLAKIVVTIAIAGFAVVEGGSPLWTRAQLDDIAHSIADEGAAELVRTKDPASAQAAAAEEARARDVQLTAFTADAARVHVTVYRRARSYLLYRFGPTKGWYDVSVDADAASAQS